MKLVLFFIFVLSLLGLTAGDSSQGTFELRLKSFSNPMEKDQAGHCCAGYRAGSSGRCTSQCRTKFRVCLKHYQATINPSDACTFGESYTPVVRNNVANFDTIQFPLDFKWPGTFSLIIEAWHENNETSKSGSAKKNALITRLATQQQLSAGAVWNPKVHKDLHSTLEYEYRMVCSAHYYGGDCDTLCRPRDDQFGHYTCGSDGQKVCIEGWQKDPSKPEGDYCTKAKCLEGCHDEHGECDRPGQCKCKTGFTGPLCDRCILYPGCVHGSCEKPYQCLCKEGWGGLFCNQDLNYCTNHRPCRNGATCRNTGQGSYTCSCPPGYTGTNCESRISNECEHQPCFNGGTCQGSGVNDYKCVCPLGFHGKHCERSAQTCSDAPCKNDASCVDRFGGGYECRCRKEFQGVNCDVEIDHCRATPCQNGGTCSLTGDSFQCRCPVGFSGSNCEVNEDDCALNPCQNGGTCFDFVNDYKCYCHAGFIGNNCEVNVNDCLTSPCANGGTCHDSVNDFICTCPPGFAGKDCSQEVNECAANPCMHGFCVDKVNDFQCKCLPGYSGKHCNVLPDGTILDFPGALNSEQMDDSQVALIATFSIVIPLLVIFASLCLCCSKRRRRAEQRRADLDAERENELNTVHCINKTKMLDDHMIVNSLDFPRQKSINTNPNLAAAGEELYSAKESVCGYNSKGKMLGGKSLNSSSSALCDKLENSSVVSGASSASSASSMTSASGPRYCNIVPPPQAAQLLPSGQHMHHHHPHHQQQQMYQPSSSGSSRGFESASTASTSAASSVASASSQPQSHYQHRSKEYGLPTAASINAAASGSSNSSPSKSKAADLFATEV